MASIISRWRTSSSGRSPSYRMGTPPLDSKVRPCCNMLQPIPPMLFSVFFSHSKRKKQMNKIVFFSEHTPRHWFVEIVRHIVSKILSQVISWEEVHRRQSAPRHCRRLFLRSGLRTLSWAGVRRLTRVQAQCLWYRPDALGYRPSDVSALDFQDF